MRVPKRRGEELRRMKQQIDNHLTKDAIERMKKKVERLIAVDRPEATKELQRTQEMGDLSENAAYQEAKWTLRRINSQIITLGERVKNAIVIKAVDDGIVQIGCKVAVHVNGKQKTFEIVGSQEADPLEGRISYSSPIGGKLIGATAGDSIEITINGKDVVYDIIEVML